MKWNKFFFYARYIVQVTDKSFLIALPPDSELADYYFWVSKRLIGVSPSRHDIAGLLYGEDFTFNIFKENHFGDKIETKTVSGHEIERALSANIDVWFNNLDDWPDDAIEGKPEHIEPILDPQPCKELIDE